MIPLKDFKTIVVNTPLVSIDFMIENSEAKYPLGKRVNAPAKGYWFTLGGRILKNEPIENAIKRLSKQEFNKVVTKDMLQFFGVFEHFYDDSLLASAGLKRASKKVAYKIVERRDKDIAECFTDSSYAKGQPGWNASRSINIMCKAGKRNNLNSHNY